MRAATAPVAAQLSQRAPGAFDVHRYSSLAAAELAVRTREVDAAFVPGPGPATLVTASAAGAVARASLVELFGGLAASTGTPLHEEDVAPLPEGDRAGLSPFLLAVSVLLPSLLAAVGIAVLGRRSSPPRRLLAAAGAAAGIGLTNAWVVDQVLGALTGHYWELAGIAALLSLAVSGPALALHRLLGAPGLALAALLFLVLGMPTSGAAVGPHYLPDLFAALTSAFPGGEAIPAIRGTVYFSGADVGTDLARLGTWAAAAVVALLAPSPRRTASPLPARATAVRPA